MSTEEARCATCLPGDLSELENLRSHVGACSLHWHKFSVEVGGLIVGAAVALAGFVLTRDGLSQSSGYALSGTIFLLGVLGFLTIRYVKKQFYVHANILRKIDTLTGVFCAKRYAGLDGMLYPKEWMSSGQDGYKEPLVTYAGWAALIAPIILAALVAFVTYTSG